MDKTELIEAFENQDMGDVEFLEMAMELGMELDEIEAILASVREEL